MKAFKRQEFITLLIVILLSLLVWFLGPYLFIVNYHPLADASIRLMIIMCFIIIWGVNNWRLQYKRSHKEELELLAKQQPPNADEQQEQNNQQNTINAFKKQLLQTLLQEKDYQTSHLPAYLVMGSPQSGKSALLANSGLSFQQQPTHRNNQSVCDFWLGETAIFIEPKIQHFAQDPAIWETCIKELQQKRPISGIILCLKVEDLMQQDGMLSNQLYQQLNTIQLTGSSHPVYLVVNQSDHIVGFNEYFANLTVEERTQILGVSFEKNPKNLIKESQQKFDTLLKQLREQVYTRLQQESEPNNRLALFNFPKQMAALQSKLERFIESMIDNNSYKLPLLRGIYFTSSHTEQSQHLLCSPTLTSLSKTLDLEALPVEKSTSSTNYFNQQLFKQLILPEKNLARPAKKILNNTYLLRTVAFSLSVVVIVVNTFLWHTSYENNLNVINQLDNDLKRYQASLSNLNSKAKNKNSTAIIAQLRSLRTSYDTERKLGFMRWGLYQGSYLQPSIQAFYQQEIQQYVK